MGVRNFAKESPFMAAFATMNLLAVGPGFVQGKDVRQEMGTNGTVVWESGVTGIVPAISASLCPQNPSSMGDFDDANKAICLPPIKRTIFNASAKLGDGPMVENTATLTSVVVNLVTLPGQMVGSIAGHAYESAQPGNDDQKMRPYKISSLNLRYI